MGDWRHFFHPMGMLCNIICTSIDLLHAGIFLLFSLLFACPNYYLRTWRIVAIIISFYPIQST
jgi:hypothetical protein